MRKKLYFDETFKIGRSLHILINNGKIREYEGADFMPLILHGQPQPEFKTFELNSDFKLIKVSKYDRKKLNIKANYQVDCHYLRGKFLKDSYIKLNVIEKFIINYSKKESILHKMNFNQKLISVLAFVTIPFLFMLGWNHFMNKESNDSKSQIPNPDSKTINQEIKTPIIKVDSVSTQTIKLDLDSLSIE
ncbi:hypothetical protein SAMN04487765_3678 [Tenacibaculum sp. MAR_2010_89]|uniref:hypothetical protein n=1 Tax=Tenacibaculum sp. MAR_2010_89 TaxID=1250198 RepID=UPI00089C5A54|nr:hypothetical protein [Tenacibaculum sp. MAR_2010_89]SEE66423.1 hypothetical protein SAMN04487765_3678 [Tenacibaculum sp. MAR_2010_89]